ncbi:MAG: hypothetical protein OCU12_06275 [Methanophagales archaeon]|nr:hypothetical protein [Methanophagales archaeon]
MSKKASDAALVKSKSGLFAATEDWWTNGSVVVFAAEAKAKRQPSPASEQMRDAIADMMDAAQFGTDVYPTTLLGSANKQDVYLRLSSPEEGAWFHAPTVRNLADRGKNPKFVLFWTEKATCPIGAVFHGESLTGIIAALDGDIPPIFFQGWDFRLKNEEVS